MQRYKYFFVSTVLCLFISQFGDNASAQALYKYTDKDGKISYSDRVPKPGEKAELVTTDLETNIMAAPKNTVGGVKQTIQDVNARGKQRAINRDKLLKEVEEARAQVALTKKALEDGKEALPEERQIVVRTNSPGKNTVIYKESYRERIAALETNLKIAEKNLELAEEKYHRTAP